ncbi:hypothetical protein HID58_086302, partial [Brassica napus]
KGAADEEKNVAFVFQPGKLIKLLRKHHLRDATRYMLSNSCLSTSFVKSVLRENKNAIDEFLMSKSVPLRSGLQDFQTSTSFYSN